MPHALIAGGGVAGPVAAIALIRAGWSASVFEASAPEDAAPGSWLTLQANGMDALGAVGARAAADSAGVPTRTMRFWNGRGRPLGWMTNGAPLADGTTSRLVQRSQFTSALREEAAARGALIERSAEIVRAETDSSGATLVLADGRTVRGDVVIGADGLRSVVRRAIDPNAPDPRYVPVLNVGGTVETDLSHLGWPASEFQMLFGLRCFFGIHPLPTGGAVWFANPPERTEPDGAGRAAMRGARWRERLMALLADDRGPVADAARTVVAAADDADLVPWTTYDVPTVPRWHRGRLAIIGDAAHATSPSAGQGASLALEDAVLIARFLRDVPDPAAAFTAFVNSRRRRVERIVAAGNRGSTSKAAGPVGRVVRDATLPVVFLLARHGDSTALRSVTGHHIEWETTASA